MLVTHALHFLPQVDYVYTIADGRIGEHGTYADLMGADGPFARFVNEFGSKESEAEKEEEAVEEGAEDAEGEDEKKAEKAEKRKKAQAGAALMQTEERNTGAVTKEVYMEYIRAGKGYVIIPLLILSVALLQVSQVMSSYWYVVSPLLCRVWLTFICRLVYWQEVKWNFGNSFYVRLVLCEIPPRN